MGKPKESKLNRIELAEVMLNDAQIALQHRRYRCTISRSYYACYHAANTCLEAIGEPIKKKRGTHRACLTLFSMYFIKTGILPVELGKTLKVLMAARETADYAFEIKNLKRKANQYYKDAKIFLNEVKHYAETKEK